MPNYTTDRRWYLTADQSEAVEEGDERAATLLAGAGTELPAEVAEQYDLAKKAKANPVETTAEDDPAQPSPSPEEVDKAAEPEEDKAQRPAANKAR